MNYYQSPRNTYSLGKQAPRAQSDVLPQGMSPQTVTPSYTPSPFTGIENLGFIPSMFPTTGDPMQDQYSYLDWNARLAQGALGMMAPGLQWNMAQPTAQTSLPGYTSLPAQTIPDYYGLSQGLESIDPNALSKLLSSTYQSPGFAQTPAYQSGDFYGAPQYQAAQYQVAPQYQAAPYQGAPQYQAAQYYANPALNPSQFYDTTAITPNVLENPQFKAFKAEMGQATEDQSRAIANEMARRGILSSGATKDVYGDLGEASSRAIASEMGRIAGPLLQQSAIQQNILEPQRRTAFGQQQDMLRYQTGAQEAQRQTAYGAEQMLQQFLAGEREAGRQTAFGAEQSLQQQFAGEREAGRQTAYGAEQMLQQFLAGEREAGRQTAFGAEQSLQQQFAGEREAGRQTAYGAQTAQDLFSSLLKGAERETGFSERQALLQNEAQNRALQNLMQLGSAEAGTQREHRGAISELVEREFLRARGREQEEVMLPLQNQALQDTRTNQMLAAMNALLTGQQPAVQSSLSALSGLQSQIENRLGRQQQTSSTNQQQEMADLQSWLGMGTQAAPLVKSGLESLWGWASGLFGGSSTNAV